MALDVKPRTYVQYFVTVWVALNIHTQSDVDFHLFALTVVFFVFFFLTLALELLDGSTKIWTECLEASAQILLPFLISFAEILTHFHCKESQKLRGFVTALHFYLHLCSIIP